MYKHFSRFFWVFLGFFIFVAGPTRYPVTGPGHLDQEFYAESYAKSLTALALH